MIVRDEAAMIDACLASVQGVVDEIIVLDTGSRDDTKERARRAGAKVFEATWRDDFSAARNASLARATGDWVLVLDADERLDCPRPEELRRLLRGATFDCGLIRLHDALSTSDAALDVLSGRRRLGDAQRVPRLLRRLPDLAYTGVIHEDLGPWLVRHGRKVAALDLDIVHYGAAREVYVAKGKFERNVKLLEELARTSPEDPTALGYLAHQYLGQGRLAEAHAVTEEGWRRVGFVETSLGYRPSILRLAEARAQIQLKTADAAGALQTVSRCRRVEGEHFDLDYIAGCALEALASGESEPVARQRLQRGARASFESCLARSGVVYLQAFVEGATSWAAQARLGAVALSEGDGVGARVAFEAVLTSRPTHAEARLGLVESYVLDGNANEALRLALDLAADETLRKTPDLWILAAWACEVLGALQDMARFLSQARAAPPSYVGPQRRMQHAERLSALAMYQGHPVAAPGLVGAIGALLARTPIAPRDVGFWPSRPSVVDVLIQNLARSGQLGLIEPLLEPRGEVVVPGITADVRGAAERFGLRFRYEPPASRILVEGRDASVVMDVLCSHDGLRPRLTLSTARASVIGRRVWADPDAPLAGSGHACHVSARALLLDPPRECDRLLAALGEAGATPLVQRALERYEAPSQGLARVA